ncbi:MAG: hypothetical protein IPK19_05090 [Chloroflexi bacterium]|nr:hypothetical protein [Chloroflexota bacterium]
MSRPRLARPRLPRGRRLILALAAMLVVGLLGVALVFLAPRLLSRFRPAAPIASTAEPTVEATEEASGGSLPRRRPSRLTSLTP